MNNKYWEENIETMPTEQLRAIAAATVEKNNPNSFAFPLLQESVQRAWNNI